MKNEPMREKDKRYRLCGYLNYLILIYTEN